MYGYTKTTQAFDKDSRLTAVHNREVCPALKEKKYSRPINWPEEKHVYDYTKARQALDKDSCLTTVHIR